MGSCLYFAVAGDFFLRSNLIRGKRQKILQGSERNDSTSSGGFSDVGSDAGRRDRGNGKLYT